MTAARAGLAAVGRGRVGARVVAAGVAACATLSATLAMAFECPPIPKKAAAAEALSRHEFDAGIEVEAAAPREALKHFRCAALAADRPAIDLHVGTVLERLGDDTAAATAFERYLELAGNDAPDA